VPHFRATIDGNNATGGESSQTGMCEQCDGCLTARRSKLNGVALKAKASADACRRTLRLL